MPRHNDKRPVPSISLTTLWRGLVRDLFSDYRPERHYMRGRGPAWNAKHQGA